MTSTSFGAACLRVFAPAILFALSSLTPSAHASNTLVGGGATAPTLGLVGNNNGLMQTTPPTSSFFGLYSAQPGNPQTSYCMDGSGMGKEIFTVALSSFSPEDVQSDCVSRNTERTIGFGARSVGRGDLLWPDFAVSDAPLTSTDYSNYITFHPASKPVQFPILAESIAITFTKGNVQSLALTDTLICKLFSGQITDWSDPQLALAGVPAGMAGPIQIVYDSDGSGTTFGLGNHLAAVCPGTPLKHFIADQSFARVVSLYFLDPAGLVSLPSTWIAQSGNQNVVNTVLNTDGTLAYAGAADVANDFGNFATVNGLDPIVDMAGGNYPGLYTVGATDLVYNQVVNGWDITTGRPTVTPILSAPTTSCIALMKPQAYANPQNNQYPIVSIAYFLANSNGNGTDAASLRNLLWAPYNTSITRNVGLTSIGPGTGLAFLATTFTPWQIASCIVN